MVNRPVLLGGRKALRVHSVSLWLLWTWLPVAVCLAAVARESTDGFSSAHTSGWLRHLAQYIFGPITQPTWERAHYAVRKTGHFLGYGLVGLAWLRAWLLMSVTYLKQTATARWRSYSVAMALCCTMLSAALDELHQTFIPSRTGIISDAWLDTAGAVVLIGFVSVIWWRSAPQLALSRDSGHTNQSA